MAGPVCGRMLADLGADVIKVERIPGGDASRGFVPPDIGGESAAFMMLNRNKRGIAVDLKSDGGREVVRRLARRADVLIENYRAGTLERLGLGYERLRGENPGLILCEISGFGRTGPYADIGGVDLIAQGYSGLMSVTGEGPGRPPVKCGPPLTDITAGILGAVGVLAAYVHRQATGEGQRVDTSLFEAGITQTYWQSAITLATGVSPGPLGSAHPLSAPYQAFETRDGWVNVGASSEETWKRLIEVLGHSELRRDARFRTNAARMGHLSELVALLAPEFKKRSTHDWVEALERAGVPAGPVLTIGEMLDHPQTAARAMRTRVPHAKLGAVETLGFPIHLRATPAEVRRGAPMLGEHTREVLAEFGYQTGEIEELVKAGAVLALI
ncbi:MAG: CoA transferase [Gemmatimonadetes bacterium]|nr:CoA transferase [Gemmatimonadota bacterium]